MLKWFRSMTRIERLTILACFLGWALDAMDNQTANLLLPTLSDAFGVSKAQIGLMATVTLIASGFGGWLAGAASDRFGRVLVLQVTIAWFSIGSLLCAFAPSFEWLVAARIFQGIGFGGEWAVGAVLVAEITRPQWRATAVGVVQSGYSIGLAMAAGLYFATYSLLPEDLAWRAVFLAGALPALLIVFIRSAIREPARTVAVPAYTTVPNRSGSLWRVFMPPYLGATVLGSLLCLTLQGASAAIVVWLPTLLKVDHGLGVGALSLFFLLQSGGAFLGYLGAAMLSDRAGRRISLWVFTAGAMVSIAVLCFVPMATVAYLALAIPFGFFAFGVFSNFGPVLSELYPADVRGSGQGFCYNFGRGVGAFFPALVGVLAVNGSLPQAVGLVSLAAYVGGCVMVLILPETRGKILDVEAVDAADAPNAPPTLH